MVKNHIAVVLPVYNRVKETIECIKRLEKLDSDKIQITTILVDDGSTDGTEKIISTNFPAVEILKGNGDLWWAGGVNKGLKHIKENKSQFDYILILNSDTFFTESTLYPLLSVVKNNKKTVCASLVIDEESGKIYNAGQIRSGFLQELKPIFNGEYLSCHQDKIIDCDTVGTRFVLMPIEIIENVGLFDSKKFVHGFSDFEYFLRAQKMGYKIKVNTKSFVSTLQNINYLNKRLIDQDIISYLKAFFDIKYDTNFRLIFHSSFSHKPFFIGYLTLIKSFFSILKWTILKLIIPQNKLREIVASTWKFR